MPTSSINMPRQREEKNKVERIQDEVGQWVEGESLQGVVKKCFANTFSSFGCQGMEIENLLKPHINSEQNEILLKPFTMEEVKPALFNSLCSLTSHWEPNGMNLSFYQSLWYDIGGHFATFLVGCLNNMIFLVGLNDAHIVLIFKKQVPTKVADLRPIALCNVTYKNMMKMIANIMKELLGNVISEPRSAFVPNRLVVGNILVASKVYEKEARRKNKVGIVEV